MVWEQVTRNKRWAKKQVGPNGGAQEFVVDGRSASEF
ncbi:hypothetical protein V1286_005083 [Bradyrhizobium algeriense]|uniref:Uncharacterized protein n=1 Tax=Bradyrhizobium algeriense TaxID=634784 RepID=A0ABU8BG86_9BRAD